MCRVAAILVTLTRLRHTDLKERANETPAMRDPAMQEAAFFGMPAG